MLVVVYIDTYYTLYTHLHTTHPSIIRCNSFGVTAYVGAVEYINQWVSPKELSDNLKDAALRCTTPDEGMRENMILKMQIAVLDVCEFLESIIEREIE